MFFSKHKTTIIVFLLTAVAAFFHFYNLNWGAPFYFHPDERNIASSVSQLKWPDNLNPHFFAYGSLPIYTIYFTGLFVNYLVHFLNPNLQSLSPNFEQAIIISRFYCALFATLLIPILFLIGKKLKNETAGIIAAFLGMTSTGFIQFAHFGTFEMWLTFFSTLLFFTCLEKNSLKNVVTLALLFGVLVAIKISSLVLFPLLIAVVAKKIIGNVKKHFKFRLIALLRFLGYSFLMIFVAAFIYFITNPYVFFDWTSFQNSMTYETTLALGTLPVFYTGEFYHSIPVVFHFSRIYPFLLNPLVTMLFLFSFFYLIFKVIKTKQTAYILLIFFYLMLFLSQAFLFVKWTRYLVPTLPFIYLIVAVVFSDFMQIFKKSLTNKHAVIGIIIAINLIFAASAFITSFVQNDTRVVAEEFAKKHIPANSRIISEVYDLGIVPFNVLPVNIALFNFYDLDNNNPQATLEILNQELKTTDYIILPSSRILKTRLINGDQFPKGYVFYFKLINNMLNFKKIYETPCDIFCKITYLGNPIFHFEQTANVFDRPTLFIYKKT